MFGKLKTDKNTFIVWEPHSRTHADCVPGWSRYLLDMGFKVIAVVGARRVNDGLFRYRDKNLSVVRMPQPLARMWMKRKDFSNAAGILVASGEVLKHGKAKRQKPGYEEAYRFFKRAPREKIFLVFHDIKKEVDAGHSPAEILTLDKMDYKGAKTVSASPHYFGDIAPHNKNEITNFITIGTLRGNRRNSRLMVESAQKLHDSGIRGFKITAVGRHVGSFRVPKELRGYFDLHDSLPFGEMFEKIEKADFFLPLLDADTDTNHRYITTGTSGNFLLMYGFAKPPIIAEKFAEKKSFDAKNSIIYKQNADLAGAMARAVSMTAEEYNAMRSALRKTADEIYKKSLANFKRLVKTKTSAADTGA